MTHDLPEDGAILPPSGRYDDDVYTGEDLPGASVLDARTSLPWLRQKDIWRGANLKRGPRKSDLCYVVYQLAQDEEYQHPESSRYRGTNNAKIADAVGVSRQRVAQILKDME